jgi:hypothetical protein
VSTSTPHPSQWGKGGQENVKKVSDGRSVVASTVEVPEATDAFNNHSFSKLFFASLNPVGPCLPPDSRLSFLPPFLPLLLRKHGRGVGGGGPCMCLMSIGLHVRCAEEVLPQKSDGVPV